MQGEARTSIQIIDLNIHNRVISQMDLLSLSHTRVTDAFDSEFYFLEDNLTTTIFK